MIQIRVTDIPIQGLDITDVLSLELLNDRMNEAPDNDIQFTSAPEFSLCLKNTKGGYELRGNVSCKYQQPCGRCLEPLEHTIDNEIELHLKQKSSHPGVDRSTTSKEWADDVGIIYFVGEHIDLEEILQESLILTLSPFNSDHEGCRGKDEIEKNNDKQESTNNLGKLLKDALIQ